jgi:hypothetical protein
MKYMNTLNQHDSSLSLLVLATRITSSGDTREPSKADARRGIFPLRVIVPDAAVSAAGTT